MSTNYLNPMSLKLHGTPGPALVRLVSTGHGVIEKENVFEMDRIPDGAAESTVTKAV